ncbi:MAG: hypothetical protein B7Z78_11555 [Rhodospirillales bacterium 20-60-12]|nr:MAG: hypothetical protein B7Z78_11555 [Rhodospirillales bacterium 20-60-12]HQT68430.1 hypothetical protein [Acetobacteraceae bacterium]
MKPFAHGLPVQISPPPVDDISATTLVYVPVVNDAAIAALKELTGSIIAFSPTPAALEDRFYRPGMVIESAADRLLTEFRHNVVGL